MNEDFTAVVQKLQQSRWGTLLISILAFGFLSVLILHSRLQWHGFALAFSSAFFGNGVFALIEVCIWTSFLKPHIQNQPRYRQNKYPIPAALKKLKFSFIKFCLSIAGSLFCFFILLWQQPETNTAISNDLFFDACIVSFMCFIIFSFGYTFIREKILKIRPRHYSKGWDPWGDSSEHPTGNHVNHHPTQSNSWNAWDHDPMNPASSEYQSTYRHWNHLD